MLMITVNIICEGLLLISFSIALKKLLLKNLPISSLECKNKRPYPVYAQSDWKIMSLRVVHTYVSHIREYYSPPGQLNSSYLRYTASSRDNWRVTSLQAVLYIYLKTFSMKSWCWQADIGLSRKARSSSVIKFLAAQNELIRICYSVVIQAEK